MPSPETERLTHPRRLQSLLRERQPALKSILHTGNPEATACLGEVAVLAKPVHPEDLAKKIEAILVEGSGGSKHAA